MTELWGAETRKAIDNFPVSGRPIPVGVVRWLGRIKAAAARVNADLGLLDAGLAGRIAAAGDAIAAGEHDDQFPIDVFQTGSGTSSNMNANEVMAALAGEGVHPNDHVNLGQSSNDVFPSAVHLAALDAATNDLLPALGELEAALAAKAEAFADVVKAGRTHLMDAVPVTLGQEFGGYAAQIHLGRSRIEDALPRLGQIPLGGTATGTGLNTHPEFAQRVRALLADASRLPIAAPLDHFEAQANRDALIETSGALKVVAASLTKIANDLRWMGSGPRAGLGELLLPELQKGSSIMPGKVNPVICEVVTQVSAQVIGNDTAITIGGMSGAFELNVYIPLMARNLLESISLLAAASRLFARKCVDGLEADIERNEQHGEGTLAMATALNPYIGYDRATAIVRDATSSGRSLREVARAHGVEESVLDKALDLRAIARGNSGEAPTSYLRDRGPAPCTGFLAAAGREVLVVARALQRPPQPQPMRANARVTTPPSLITPGALPRERAVDVPARRGVARPAARDVRVLDRVEVDRPAVGVLGPVGRAGRAAAVEGRGVVGLDRVEVGAAIGLDRQHAADREARGVELAERARDGRGDRPVHDQRPAMGMPVEADVGERDAAQVGERDRAAGPPHRRRHRRALRGGQLRHLRVVRRERGGSRGNHSAPARRTPAAASCCSSAR